MSARRDRFRWFVAIGAIAAGIALAWLELRDPPATSFEQWFWLATAGIVAGFGVVEVIALFRGSSRDDNANA